MVLSCDICQEPASSVKDLGYGDFQWRCSACQPEAIEAIPVIDLLRKLSYQNSRQSELLSKVCGVLNSLKTAANKELLHKLEDWSSKNKNCFR